MELLSYYNNRIIFVFCYTCILEHKCYLVQILSILFQMTACTSGSYGQDCLQSCGNCAGGGACDTVDGSCPIGCDPGWSGATCHQGENRVIQMFDFIC